MLLGKLREDVRSLNSSILIITQKMKYVVRNEKILGRNLIVLNKKLKVFEEKIVSGQIGSQGAAGGLQAEEMQAKLDAASQQIASLEARLQQLSESTASKEEVQEMHFVVDAINPLEFVTIEQAKELIKGRNVKPRKPKKK